MNQGWIKLHRTLQDNKLWYSEPLTKGQAWVDLILLANHKDGMINVRGQLVEIKRGQVGYAKETLAKMWRWSRGKVTRFLVHLEKEGNIIQQNNNILGLIQVIKYNEYQSNDTTDGTTDGQQTVHKQEVLLLSSKLELVNYLAELHKKGKTIEIKKEVLESLGLMTELGFKINTQGIKKEIKWCDDTIKKYIGVSQETGQPLYNKFQSLVFEWHTYWISENKDIKNHKSSLLNNIKMKMNGFKK